MKQYSINYAKGLLISFGTALVIAVLRNLFIFCITLEGSIEIFFYLIFASFFMFIWGKTPDNNFKKIFIVKSMINTRKKYHFSMDLKRDNIQQIG